MKAKVVSLKTKGKAPNDLSIEECRKMFKASEYGYTDDELIQMKDFLFKLAKMYYELYTTKLKHQPKTISLNNEPYDTEESHTLCKSEYRRAS
jgi:hypothetical protein